MKRFLHLILLLTIPVLAQDIESYNMRAVGYFDTGYASDIWGYNAPNGNEYALVGAWDATAIINVTANPADPVLTGWIPGPGSIWRDLKTHEHYCYVVNESGEGMHIIDLADPDNPVFVGNYTATFTTAHNIYITDGYAYIFGANNSAGGVRILDLADPEDPVEVGSWEVDYIHDGYVKNDTLYASGIYNGILYIVDVSNKSNPVTMKVHQYSNYGCHQVWVGENSRYIYTADEKESGYVNIWDAADYNNINLVSSYQVGQHKSVHNVFIKGDLLYASYYVFGTRVVDISDPTNPVEVGYFDGYPGSTGLYNGNWGTFPYTNSGMIYSTFSEFGLAILAYPDMGSIMLTDYLPDTEDLNNPYPVTVTVNEAPDYPLDYSTIRVISGLNGTFSDTSVLSATGTGNDYTGFIPAAIDSGMINYYFSISTIDGSVITEPYGAPNSSFSFYAGPDHVLPVIASVSQAEDDIYPSGSREILVQASDNVGVDSVFVQWTINGMGNNSVVAGYDTSQDGYVAHLNWDGLYTGDIIRYTARVIDASSNHNETLSEEYSFSITNIFIAGDFEGEMLDNWDLGTWGIQYVNADVEKCLNDSPQSQYPPNDTSWASLTVPLDLSVFDQAYIHFTSLSALEDDHDFGYFQLSTDGQNWETKATATGMWVIEEIYISLDSLLNDPIYLRLMRTSDSTVQSFGWFVNDIEVVVNTDMPQVETEDDGPEIATAYHLAQNYPNPFNPITTIAYSLPQQSHVTLSVYDMQGREMAVLVRDVLPAGNHDIKWNGKDRFGNDVPAGMYFARITAERFSQTIKMVLLK
ncbi:MAG: choice-of-anchor B family protein [Fidelibacterota bacterium]